MTYEPLVLYCQCGYPADSITGMGLTPEHQLVVHWRCSACHEEVNIFKDLADCWRECPPRPDHLSIAEASENNSDIEAGDLVFLNSMGINPL